MFRFALSLLLAMILASAPVFQAQAGLAADTGAPFAVESSATTMDVMAECDHCDECEENSSMPDCAAPCLLSCAGGTCATALLTASGHDVYVTSDVVQFLFAQRRSDAPFSADPPPPRI